MRIPVWGVMLCVAFWSAPSIAQDTLKYDLTRTSLEYRLEIVQDTQVPLPTGEMNQVRTSVRARMGWMVEAEKENGARVVRIRLSDFDTSVTIKGGNPRPYEYLESLAPFEFVIVITPRGEIQQRMLDMSNPARSRALNMFQDLVVGGLPVLPVEAVSPGASWSHEDKSDIDFDGVLASAVIQRKFRLESAGLVGYSAVGTIDATVDVAGKKVTRRTKVHAEGSATFVGGVIKEQAASWTASSEATKELGASKNRTTVRLRLVK